ncbi:MAG TPA: metallophosphoesterase [Bacillus bacterium]|uniref:Metallophosphoesterase YkoQ n=1 Tax=Siminovitchia fordii TaxID=254759 RepID=A0ABQ4K1W0_9BACI|nr:metallophosphoesterase [Siminovitchia fordii]GIN19748.1 putative metallophosphoesterase YkoQ [Siminovitchia fordii]HBZ10843.1 metallophosphoesterase [Bacillus sp. (in: firmicutes)]
MTAAIIILIALCTFIYIGNKNTRSVVINHIDIDCKNDLKKNPEPLRILHISDLHLENISISPEQLYESIRSQPIDLIALTGDFMDRKKSIPKLLPYLHVLKKLEPGYGIYAVLGNHDYVLRKDDLGQLKNLLILNGVKLLQNENHNIDIDGVPLNIIGIDDFSTKRSNLMESYDGLQEGYNLVITHDPNIVLSMHNYHFDYLLSGHFHGGQIHWPKPYHLVKMGKLVKMNMIKGLQKYKEKQFYISEGLGQTGVNIRIGSRPEITIHNIRLPHTLDGVKVG